MNGKESRMLSKTPTSQPVGILPTRERAAEREVGRGGGGKKKNPTVNVDDAEKSFSYISLLFS
jgi:hypothetical protein